MSADLGRVEVRGALSKYAIDPHSIKAKVGGGSVRIFWEVVLLEMLNGTINMNPVMFRLLFN